MITKALNELHLPPDAIEFLKIGWDAMQTTDDILDGDFEKAKGTAEDMLYNMLVNLPLNDFFITNRATLIPVISNAMLIWKASFTVETLGQADEKSYMWRASFYNVLLETCRIVHGLKWARENAHVVLGIYGESFEDYRKEFHLTV